LSPPIAVAGVSVRPPQRVLDRSLEEMIADTARDTVADAGLTLDDVDGVVLSGYDQIDGRVISAMVSAGPAAAVGRDMTMIPSSSEHALVYAYMRLLSGQGRNVLVLAWAKPSESVRPEHAELVTAEPFVLRPIGMNATVAAALQASRLAAEANGMTGGDGGGSGRYVAWPLRAADLPANDGDAVCGLVLTVADAVPAGARTAWIPGVGWSTDRYDLGDREVAAMPALRAAVERAYAMAGGAEAEAIEVHAPSRPALRRAVEIVARNRAVDVNPSGGLDTAYPEHAAGLARMAQAAQRVRDGAKTAVGASVHGLAGQGAAVAVFTRDQEAR